MSDELKLCPLNGFSHELLMMANYIDNNPYDAIVDTLWHQPAETMRDALLRISGELDAISAESMRKVPVTPPNDALEKCAQLLTALLKEKLWPTGGVGGQMCGLERHQIRFIVSGFTLSEWYRTLQQLQDYKAALKAAGVEIES